MGAFATITESFDFAGAGGGVDPFEKIIGSSGFADGGVGVGGVTTIGGGDGVGRKA